MRRLAWPAFVVALAFGAPAYAAVPATSDLDAQARAQGNRLEDARALGRALLVKVWPAQLLHVRVDGAGTHEVAGLVLSAVKFHDDLDQAGFNQEIEELVRRAFEASAVEEVDVWATVPIPIDKREPVSGDYAQPTSRIVFAVTCPRQELGGLGARLRSGAGVYWADDFKRRLRPSAP